MIPFRGVEGIRNLYLPKRCDICGKKRRYIVLCGSICVRCTVWNEWHRHMRYLIMKYIRFSIRKYLCGEVPRPRSIPDGYDELIQKYKSY